jgi:Domain of unknown function (DUF4349)
MNTAARARRIRGPLRTTALLGAGLMSGAALLLAGCSHAGPSAAASSGAPARVAHGASQNAGAGAPASAPLASGSSSAPASSPASQAAQLALASPDIIYTANLAIRTANVTAAASRATGIVLREGGYVSSEQATIDPADHARSAVTLQLKVPVAAYDTTLATLAAVLGTQTSLTQHAQDVTQQVADVSSLVTSAQDAITQLQVLLKRAGSIGDLLAVQEQINTQESSLEALQAQQRALTRETSYATVSVMLVGPQHQAPARHQQRQRGFVAGLTAGWRALRLAVSAILTALGAALPFLVIAAVLAAAGFAGRRRWRRWRRLLRRGSRPTPAG